MDKKTSIAVVIGVIVIALAFGTKILTNNDSSALINNNAQNNQNMDSSNNTASTTQQVTELQYQDTVIGTGTEAVAGKKVTVHYTGVFTNGTVFDSSVQRGTPFTFDLGTGSVIKGWDIGVQGMKVGGTRILVIPPAYGYGSSDYGSIPGNSTLIFQVQLLKVE